MIVGDNPDGWPSEACWVSMSESPSSSSVTWISTLHMLFTKESYIPFVLAERMLTKHRLSQPCHNAHCKSVGVSSTGEKDFATH